MTRPQHILLAIIGLLALPFVVATLLYLSGWRPAQTSNHGRLIVPPTAIAAPGIWFGQWSLVLMHDAPCGDACRARLDELRRLRRALGRDMEQTRVVWLGNGNRLEAAGWLDEMPDVAVIDGRSTAFSRLPAGSLLVVDPQGQAMLRYPPDTAAMNVHRDLSHLLKITWQS